MAIAVAQTKETVALAYTAIGAYVSAHTADPGTTGTAEATGGSPAYARKLTTWTGGTVDGVVTGSQVTIDVPAGTYTYIGIFSAVTVGNFVDKYLLPVAQTFASQGQLLVTPSMTIT